MSTAALVSVSEYLATTYHPDREYLDGHLLERNVGEWDHSWLQRGILLYAAQHWESLGFLAMPELRVQVKQNRYRVPDISVVRGHPSQQILTRSPFVCIEILSPDDTMSAMQERIDDYRAFGVENIWIIDPRRRKAFSADGTGLHEAPNSLLRAYDAEILLDLSSLWPVSPQHRDRQSDSLKMDETLPHK